MYLLAPPFTVGVALYFFKKIFNNYFDKKIEIYKAELNQNLLEYQIKFSKLHEVRAEIIRELYSKLVTAEIALKTFMNPIRFGKVTEEGELKLEADAREKWQTFINFFSVNEVIFTQNTCTKIEEMVQLAFKIWGQIEMSKMYALNVQDNPDNPDHRMELQQKRIEIRKMLTNNFPEVEKLLKEEFRNIIGVK